MMMMNIYLFWTCLLDFLKLPTCAQLSSYHCSKPLFVQNKGNCLACFWWWWCNIYSGLIRAFHYSSLILHYYFASCMHFVKWTDLIMNRCIYDVWLCTIKTIYRLFQHQIICTLLIFMHHNLCKSLYGRSFLVQFTPKLVNKWTRESIFRHFEILHSLLTQR